MYFNLPDPLHLLELRAQLVRFEQLSAHVPALVISDLLRDEVKRLKDVQAEMTTRFQATLDQLAGRQVRTDV